MKRGIILMGLLLSFIVLILVSGCEQLQPSSDDREGIDDVSTYAVQDVFVDDNETDDDIIIDEIETEDVEESDFERSIALIGELGSYEKVLEIYHGLKKANVVKGPFGYNVDVMHTKQDLATLFIDKDKGVLLGVCKGYVLKFDKRKSCYGDLL